jgi:hypothetical protein
VEFEEGHVSVRSELINSNQLYFIQCAYRFPKAIEWQHQPQNVYRRLFIYFVRVF